MFIFDTGHAQINSAEAQKNRGFNFSSKKWKEE
jgi:hypothetical protein